LCHSIPRWSKTAGC